MLFYYLKIYTISNFNGLSIEYFCFQYWHILGSYIGGFIIRHQSLAHTPIYGFLMVMLATIVTLLWLLFDNKKQ